jgi:hypothetical protein
MQEDGRGLRIAFVRCFKAHLGLRLRAEETLRRLHRIFADYSASWNDAQQELISPIGTLAAFVQSKLADAAEVMAVIARRLLTPRLMTAALGIITSRERLRWTKDGRLPSSGRVQVRRAGPPSIPTYSVSLVEGLVARPDILSAWRDQNGVK